jgi:hypothetical protein
LSDIGRRIRQSLLLGNGYGILFSHVKNLRRVLNMGVSTHSVYLRRSFLASSSVPRLFL